MDSVNLFLTTIAAIFLIGMAGELVFERTGIPDVLWFVAVGIVLGPVAGLVQREQLAAIAPYFGAITLVVILFDGGTELRMSEIKQTAGRSIAVGLAGFSFSAAIIAPVSMLASSVNALPEGWTWLHALTLGAITGGASAMIVVPAVRRASLTSRIASLLNVESAITDVLCVVCTVACVNIAASGHVDAESAGVALGKSFGIGVGVGVAGGLIGLLFLRVIKKSRIGYPAMLGALLVLYVITEELAGSAPLAILTAAVVIGHAPKLSEVVGLAKSTRIGRGLSNVHDQITFFVKAFFFTFVGAMLGPPWGPIVLGAMLGVLLLVARVPAVALSLVGSKLSLPAKGVVAVSLPRGMAAGVLAMLPAQAGMKLTDSLSVVVFSCLVTTILLFAVGFPVLKAQLSRIDPSAFAPDAALSSMGDTAPPPPSAPPENPS